jgi:hypothetical protein
MSTDNTELKVSEEQDGSAVISLPEDIPSPDDDFEEGGSVTASEHDGSDDDDAAAEAREIAKLGDVDPQAEAIRAAKRAKRRARKEYHKQTATEKDIRLQNLQRQNQELLERLSVVERKQSGSELARLDKAIEDQHMRITFAKNKIKEATENGDGDLLTSAQEMWFEARRHAEDLTALKKRSVQPSQQPIQQDPKVQRYASDWMERNPWYDPSSKDMDSRIALTIDQALAEEGWDPKTEDYWEELDNRLQRSLPNRYTDSNNERTKRSRPRNVVTSSGREAASNAGGKNLYTLSPDRVKALKEAGMWDNLEIRNRMIKRYAAEDRQNNGRN